MSYQHISIARDGHIASVTFNRPDKANALNFEHLTEIEHAALSFRDDAETRAVMKSNGFRWAPSQGAWQRQLTGNARHAGRSALRALGVDLSAK